MPAGQQGLAVLEALPEAIRGSAKGFPVLLLQTADGVPRSDLLPGMPCSVYEGAQFVRLPGITTPQW